MDSIYLISFVALLGVIAVVIWLRRPVRVRTAIASLRVEASPTPQLLPIRSPLERVSFEDALAVAPMWSGIRDASEEVLIREFAQHLGDGLIATQNAVRFVQQTGEYVVEFSEKGKELLQIGQATLMRSKDTGRMVPTLLDANGKIIENAREVGKLKAVAGKMASLSSVVIGAAHIISGADIAKTVGEVRKDVKFLIEGRRNEHMAEFEAAFRTAKRRLGETPSDANVAELRAVTHKLAVLRATWRRDLETKLKDIKDPKQSGRIKRLFSRQRTTDKRLADALLPFHEDIRLIEANLVLEIGIAQMIGDAETLFLHVLPDELKLMRQTSTLLSEKAAYINLQELKANSVTEELDRLIERTTSFIPSREMIDGQSGETLAA